MLSIKTPILAADYPEALDLAFAGKLSNLVDLVIERATVDENGKLIDFATLTLADKLQLIPQAAEALKLQGEPGNG